MIKLEVLFVCTGNTCRSPLAQALLQNLAQQHGLDHVKVSSAGLAAMPGSPASQGSQTVVEVADLSGHRSRQLDADILAQADLVLTMTQQHKEHILQQHPENADKTYTLMEYAGLNGDIPDPFGGTTGVYSQSKRQILQAVELVVKKFTSESEENLMKIALASDHGGYQLKEELKGIVTEIGHDFQDYGCYSEESVDYPDPAAVAARAVASKECDLGIAVCGTGQGMAIAANKIKGIRAANCHDCFSAQKARAHNNANILTLGQRVVGSELAKLIVRHFLEAEFEGGRHQQRVDKISQLEEEFGQ